MMSAPARFTAVSCSIATTSWSIHPFAAAALIMEYSPLTWYAATGRSVTTALPVARAAGMHDWAVCSNGSLLARVVPEEVVETITFDPGDLLRHIEKRVPNGSYAVECEDGTFKTNRIFKHTALTVAVREVPFDRLLDDPVIRVVVQIGRAHV